MRQSGWLVLAAAAVAAVSVYTMRHRTAGEAKADNAYVDSKQCAACHPAIARTYQRTGMARSFYRPRPENTIENYSNAKPFYHRASDTYYLMSRRDGKYYQRRWRIGYQGTETDVEESEIAFVMGSGNHVRTYLRKTPRGALIELPLAGYSENGGFWAMNPGYDTDHAIEPRKVQYGCMFCHNAYPQIVVGHDALGAEPLYAGRMPEGIDCQRCHGPGGNHVRAAQRAGVRPEELRQSIVNPARLPPERRMEVCFECHLETTSFRLPNIVKRYGRGPFDYKPGEPLGEVMMFFDHAPGSGGEGKFEIVSSAYRLRQSKCFLKSEGSLSCLTCHDPHDIPRGEEAVRHYDAVCKNCHAAMLTKLGAGHPGSANCAGCHMPKRRTEDVIHAVMTDHLIRRGPVPPGLLAALNERHETDQTAYHGEVVPYYPDPFPRTAENALYTAVAQVQQGSNLRAGIAQLTAEIQKQKPPRVEFYLELGQALENDGHPDKAAAVFEEAVRMDASSTLALRRLGVALKESGDRSRALEILKRATQAAPDDAKGWYELGLLESDLGQKAESIDAFRKAGALDPDMDLAFNSLGSALAESGDSDGAGQAFRSALRINPDSGDAQANLATLLAAKGDLKQAAYYFEKSFRRRPDDAVAHFNYAVTLARLNRLDPAQRELETAIRINGKLAEAHDVLGGLLEQKGLTDRAIEEYREAIRARPDFPKAQQDLESALAGRNQPGVRR